MTEARIVGDVVAAVDFSDRSHEVAAEGVALARASGGTLHLLHVAAGEPALAGYDKDEISPFTRSARAGELTDEHHRLRELADHLAEDGVSVTPLVVMGPTAQMILDAADHLQASHLVVGSHGHGGLHHLLVGSVAEEVVRRAKVPVVLVPVRPAP
jgi:nucleotide-binding universal stress UspA family protein